MSMSSSLTKRLFLAGEVILTLATAAAAVRLGRASEWEPPALAALLIGFAFLSESFSVRLTDGTLSASTVVIVMAMGLLGPGVAAACGIAAVIISSTARRIDLRQWLNNLATFVSIPFAGGLAVRTLNEQFGVVHGGHTEGLLFGLILLGVFALALILNFLLIGLLARVENGHPFSRQLPEFLPLLPGELAAGALAALLAVAYKAAGLPALIAAIVVLLIFQHLTVALLRSEDRAEQLLARSRQLVGLQLGVLRTLVRALEMRDPSSAHHAAAVASYATALGAEMGCSEVELDVLKTAGLLHEIGKFTWPDRVLHAETVAPEDQAIIENHPQVGSILVGSLDGYGPVADAILYHHERMDGRGYPAQLIGDEIPLASRILAICSAYDAMCGHPGYRGSMSPQEALAELRVAARNGQLDPELVETFITMAERDGPEPAEDPDFEEAFEFERRVQEIAEPATTSASSQTPLTLGRTLLSRRARS